jgi:hypothetical protein
MAKKKTISEAAFEEVILGWYAPEFIRFHRGFWWFLILGILDAALLAFAYRSASWTMGLVFIVLPAVLILEHRKKPKVVEVIFSPFGLKFGALKIPYSNLKRFWILHDPPYVDELHIMTTNRMHPEVTIPLMGVDPVQVRELLITQIPEWEGKKVSFLDTIVRILRLA